MRPENKRIIQNAQLAKTFFEQTNAAAKRADAVITAHARGILKGAQAVAKRAVQIRYHSQQAQNFAAMTAGAACAAEIRFKQMANDDEINRLNEVKLKAVTTSAENANPNDNESILRANLIKDQFVFNSKYEIELAKEFEKYVESNQGKIDFGKLSPDIEPLEAIQLAMILAASARYDAEVALAISYDADKLAEIYALAAWNARGERALRKAAKAGAIHVDAGVKPAALILLYDDYDVNYWHQFASVAGLKRNMIGEILNACHEGAIGRHGRDSYFKEVVYGILMHEASRKCRRAIEETEKAFQQGLLS